MIIPSLLDTDLYKFTVLQTMLHHHPSASARNEFICRNPDVFHLNTIAKHLNEEIEKLCSLRFTQSELEYLGSIPFFKSDFIQFLRLFYLQKDFVKVETKDHYLSIIIEGPQIHVTMFEIYLLTIISELYTRHAGTGNELEQGRRCFHDKVELLKNKVGSNDKPGQAPFELFDFGTRRRYSQSWHEEVVLTLSNEVAQCFKGTSSVYLAKKFHLKPIGTHSHEYFQSHQAYGTQLRYFQKVALEEWVQEYRGDLGIALTDTIGIDAFLRDFDLYFAKLFDGLRHDSGDPIIWGDKCIEHYKKLNLDPKTKKLVFSDALTVNSALHIYDYFKHRVQLAFGIGTNLTNDVDLPALNIVIKNTHVNGQPTAKISDDKSKTTPTDPSFLTYLKKVFEIKESD